MFRVDLEPLAGEALEWSKTVERPDEVWPDLGAEFRGPVELEARVERTGDGSVHIRGHLRAGLRLACRRCLQPIDEHLTLDLDFYFRPDVETEGEEGVWPLEARDGKIDLGPAIREEVVLAVPDFPLCSPDCGGLCPVCGARRDEAECDCETSEPDARWDALRSLLE